MSDALYELELLESSLKELIERPTHGDDEPYDRESYEAGAKMAYQGCLNALTSLRNVLRAEPPIDPNQTRLDLEKLLALVGKMRDDWAEGDASVTKSLWRNLQRNPR